MDYISQSSIHSSKFKLGEDEAGTQRRGGTRDGRTPQGPTGTWVQAKGVKGGRAPAQERHQTQAHSAGRRYERRRLSGGGCGLRPGGRQFAPVKEVRSG